MEQLDAIIGEWAAQHTAKELDAIVNEASVVCAPVYTIADVFDDPYFRERGLLVEMEDELPADRRRRAWCPSCPARRAASATPRTGPSAATTTRCSASSASRPRTSQS